MLVNLTVCLPAHSGQCRLHCAASDASFASKEANCRLPVQLLLKLANKRLKALLRGDMENDWPARVSKMIAEDRGNF